MPELHNNVLTLSFSTEFPDIITLSSNGTAAEIYPAVIGEYEIVRGIIRNGRPVWRQNFEDIYLSYNGRKQHKLSNSSNSAEVKILHFRL